MTTKRAGAGRKACPGPPAPPPHQNGGAFSPISSAYANSAHSTHASASSARATSSRPGTTPSPFTSVGFFSSKGLLGKRRAMGGGKIAPAGEARQR